MHLQAVALAHNSTPSIVTGYSPFFLEHEREAVLPVQRGLDEARLDLVSRYWLGRLWRARVNCYSANIREQAACQALLEEKGVIFPPAAWWLFV